jgi:tRNA A37 threonylcarbamoyladenosine dehydratase
VQALDGSVGRVKVEVLAERIRAIHPECRVETQQLFFHQSNSDELLATRYDYVVDAIDGVMAKARLIAQCHGLGYPVITCGGAAGKRDPSQVRVVDLSETHNDRLLVFVRRKLRRVFDFPGKGKFGVPCVFSAEPVAGCDDEADDEPESLLDEAGSAKACEGRLGAAVFVTGVFGFYAAAHVVNALTGDE